MTNKFMRLSALGLTSVFTLGGFIHTTHASDVPEAMPAVMASVQAKEMEETAPELVVATLSTKSYGVASKFADVNNSDWSAQYIQRAFDAGMVSGKTDTSFDPTATLTFQEFAVMITNAYYGQGVTNNKYLYDNGALSGNWGTPYTETLKGSYGTNSNYSSIINSLSNETQVSRYNASYIIGMLLVTEGVSTSESNFVSVATSKFTDLSSSMTSTNKGLLGVTVNNGAMFGKTTDTFDGNAILTRAEACVIMCSLLDLSESGKLSFDKYSTATSPTVSLPSSGNTSSGSTSSGWGWGTMTEEEYNFILNGGGLSDVKDTETELR